MAGTVSVTATQHIGSRAEQQDVWDSGQAGGAQVAAMADGMGGMEGGRQAAALAVRVALAWCAGDTADLPQRLVRAQQEACDAVCAIAREQDRLGSMGSTLLLAAVMDGKLFWSSSGDSRIYLVRQGRPMQLTRDHTFGSQQARRAAGEGCAPEEMDDNERRQLTSWMGVDVLDEIDASPEPLTLRHGDRVLLMSDGCYDALPAYVDWTADPGQLADRLVATAIARQLPWQDNATCVVLSWMDH